MVFKKKLVSNSSIDIKQAILVSLRNTKPITITKNS